jgi:hypothetical protein
MLIQLPEEHGRASEITVQEKVINSSLLRVPRFSPVQPASASTRGCLVLRQTSPFCSSGHSLSQGTRSCKEASLLVIASYTAFLQGKLQIYISGAIWMLGCCLCLEFTVSDRGSDRCYASHVTCRLP